MPTHTIKVPCCTVFFAIVELFEKQTSASNPVLTDILCSDKTRINIRKNKTI